MCKYCEGLKINPDSFNGEQDALYEDPEVILQIAQDTPIGRRIGSSSLDILVGSKVRHVQIFYCPMCGRKLNTIASEESHEEKKIVYRTSEEWKQEFGGPLQAIKHFMDRLRKLSEEGEDEIRKSMGYLEVGRLKFVKDMYDEGRLSELDEKLKEKEGKI